MPLKAFQKLIGKFIKTHLQRWQGGLFDQAGV